MCFKVRNVNGLWQVTKVNEKGVQERLRRFAKTMRQSRGTTLTPQPSVRNRKNEWFLDVIEVRPGFPRG